MGKSKMDEAAAERIRRARGDKDGFARRASMAARQNKAQQSQHGGSSSSPKKDGGHGHGDGKNGSGSGGSKQR